MSAATDRTIRRYYAAMIDAVNHYEEQKARYTAITDAYAIPGRDPVTAKLRAGGDPRLGEANALAVWYREEAAMYAAVIAAMVAVEPAAAVIPGQVQR